MTVTRQKPKLKWHRFLQFIGMPAAILYYGYNLISMFADLFGFDLSWTNGELKSWLTLAGTDVFHLGAYFWPVVAVLAGTLLLFVLVLLAWTGSIRWRSHSWKCWIAYLAVQLLMSIASIWLAWEYGFTRGGIVTAAQYYQARTGKTIQITPGIITALKVTLVLLGIFSLLYFIFNVIYYMKRRHLYQSVDIQEPYEDEDDEDEWQDEPVKSDPAAEPQSRPETEVPVFLTPEETAKEPEPEPSSVFMTADEPAKEEADELEALLKETEASINALKPAEEPVIEETQPVYEEPAESMPVTEPVIEETAAEEPVTDVLPEAAEEVIENVNEEPAAEAAETAEEITESYSDEPAENDLPAQPEEIVLTLDPPADLPEAEAPAERAVPFAEEVTDSDKIEETQVPETVKEEVPVSAPAALRFCPQCGTRIPDTEMRFCIHCGRKLR